MNELATFKAKFAVSNHMLSCFLAVKHDGMRDWVENDTAPEEVVQLIKRTSALIERFIQENEALAGEGPYIQTLNHQIEVQLDVIFEKQAKITQLKGRIYNIERLGFWGRLKFLVKPNVS